MTASRPALPKAPPALVRAALRGHGLLGLAMGGLLYLVCLSGTASVFYLEVQRWETPRAPEMAAATPAAVAAAVEDARAAVRAGGELFAYLPTPESPRLAVAVAGGVRAYDATGRYAGAAAHPVADGLTGLHYALNLPSGLGLVVVGLAGVAMIALIVGGFLAHPRILKDAFLWRRGQAARLARADLHNRLGVWAAPFHAAVTLTGSAIALGETVVLIAAWAFHAGDVAAAAAPLAAPAPPAASGGRISPEALAAALETTPRTRPAALPSLVRIDDVGSARERLTVTAEIPERLVYGEAYVFDSAGRLAAAHHLSDGPAGRQIQASLYRLHFGSFGGIWLRLAYFALGLGLCAICVSGVEIWLVRSAQAGHPRPALARAWAGVVWGAPAAMAAAATLTLLEVASFARAVWPLMAIFAASTLALFDAQSATRAGRTLLAAALAALVGVHLLKFGAAVARCPAALALDLAFAAGALAVVSSRRGRWREAPEGGEAR